jgi:predicted nuclease with RNAse H fold
MKGPNYRYKRSVETLNIVMNVLRSPTYKPLRRLLTQMTLMGKEIEIHPTNVDVREIYLDCRDRTSSRNDLTRKMVEAIAYAYLIKIYGPNQQHDNNG